MNCPKDETPLEAFELTGGPEVDVCPKCKGAWYDEGELDIPMTVKGLKAGKAQCPRCALKLWVGRFGKKDGPELDYCTQCGGVWMDAGELNKIREIVGRDDLVPDASPPPASKGGGATAAPLAGAGGASGGGGSAQGAAAVGAAALGAAFAPMAANIKKAQTEGDAPKKEGGVFKFGGAIKHKGRPEHKPPRYRHDTEYWDEFLLYNPKEGFVWLSREEDHYTLLRTATTRPRQNPMSMWQKAEVMVGSKPFKVYDKGKAVLDEAEGETPWVAKPGDQVEDVDLIRPPEIFSVEKSGSELEYFHGTYVDPQEVWDGFKLKGRPPEPNWISPCQPFIETPTQKQIRKVAPLFAAGFAVLLGAAWMLGGGRTVLQETFNGVGAKPVLTSSFDVKGQSVCRLDVHAKVDNSWIWLGFELLNDKNEVVAEFSKQVSYYHGRSGGESWSEGSRSGSLLFKVVDPGTYRFRVSGSGGTGERGVDVGTPWTLTLRAGYKPKRYFLVGLVLALLVAGYLWQREWSFERKRWSEVIEDDDDD